MEFAFYLWAKPRGTKFSPDARAKPAPGLDAGAGHPPLEVQRRMAGSQPLPSSSCAARAAMASFFMAARRGRRAAATASQLALQLEEPRLERSAAQQHLVPISAAAKAAARGPTSHVRRPDVKGVVVLRRRQLAGKPDRRQQRGHLGKAGFCGFWCCRRGARPQPTSGWCVARSRTGTSVRSPDPV
jgi:hypothetical protein